MLPTVNFINSFGSVSGTCSGSKIGIGSDPTVMFCEKVSDAFDAVEVSDSLLICPIPEREKFVGEDGSTTSCFPSIDKELCVD